MARIQPAQKTLTFALGEGGTAYIDLSLAASIANRRFYRQGLNWAVSGFTIFASGVSQTVGIYKIPDTWVAYNAWVKGFSLWREMNDQVLDVEESIAGRYSDFKIYMDRDHYERVHEDPFQADVSSSSGKTVLPVVRNSGSGNLILPTMVDGGNPTCEWDASQYTFPDPVDGTSESFCTHMVGENSTTSKGTAVGSKGLILGYAYSRSRPNVEDPNVPRDSASRAWMNDIFDYGDQNPDIRENLVSQNDTTPYPLSGDNTNTEFYPGGQENLNGLEIIVDSLTVSASTDYSARINVPGCNVPCGLLAVQNSGPCTFQVHLAPGPHRGYLAVPMQEF